MINFLKNLFGGKAVEPTPVVEAKVEAVNATPVVVEKAVEQTPAKAAPKAPAKAKPATAKKAAKPAAKKQQFAKKPAAAKKPKASK